MSWQKVKAKLVLAVLFFIHLIQRALFFWRKPSGLKKFLDQYAVDAIFPVSAAEREQFPSFQRCFACSSCTFSCARIGEGKAPPGFEPKYLLLGLGRSSHESEIYLEDWLPCVECGACTVHCPNSAPIHLMAEQIIERRKRLRFRN